MPKILHTSKNSIYDPISPIKPTHLSAWGEVTLAEHNFSEIKEKRKEKIMNGKITAYKMYLKRQVNRNYLRNLLNIKNETFNDVKNMYNNEKEYKNLLSEMEKKRIEKLRKEYEMFKKVQETPKLLKEKLLEEKRIEFKKLVQETEKFKFEQLLALNKKRQICKAIELENQAAFEKIIFNRKKQKLLEKQDDLQKIVENNSKMEKTEKYWENSFRKRLTKIDRIQRNLTPSNKNTISNELREDQRIQKEKIELDLSDFIKETQKKEKREKLKNEFINSIKQILNRKEINKNQEKIRLQNELNQNLLVNKSFSNESQNSYLNTRKKRLDYSSFLEKQMQDKRYSEFIYENSLSPQEIKINKSILNLHGLY